MEDGEIYLGYLSLGPLPWIKCWDLPRFHGDLIWV